MQLTVTRFPVGYFHQPDRDFSEFKRVERKKRENKVCPNFMCATAQIHRSTLKTALCTDQLSTRYFHGKSVFVFKRAKE